MTEAATDPCRSRGQLSLPRCGPSAISAAVDQHAPFSDNVANHRYDQNLSRRHGLTGELVLPDERRGQPLGLSLVSVVIRAITKRVIHPAERGLFVISGCFVWLTFPPARMTSRLALTLPQRRTALARTAGRLIRPSAGHQRDPVNFFLGDKDANHGSTTD